MPERSMEDAMAALGDERLETLDEIIRAGHARYRSYDPAIAVELSPRAQATCTYDHIVAAADQRLDGRSDVRSLTIKGLKVWLFEDAGVVVRFKKMDEDGRSRNYPTKQANAYDGQKDLDGLPPVPLRLTVGYLLDEIGDFVRTQIALPRGRGRTRWCSAIIPAEDRDTSDAVWIDVTREREIA